MLFQLHQPYSRSWVIFNPSSNKLTHWELQLSLFHKAKTPELRKLAHNYWLGNQTKPSKAVLSIKTSGWNNVSERQLHTSCTPLFTSHSVRHSSLSAEVQSTTSVWFHHGAPVLGSCCSLTFSSYLALELPPVPCFPHWVAAHPAPLTELWPGLGPAFLSVK